MTTLPLLTTRTTEARAADASAHGSGEVKGGVKSASVTIGGSRPLAGVLVVLFIVLLQTASQYFSGHDPARVLGHLCFVAGELPVTLLVLGLTYATLKRRKIDALPTVGITILVAGTLGAGFGIILYLLSQSFPMILIRPMPNLTVATAALYGFSLGQFHMGLWALAFAYPFAIEDSRMRDMEADQLRSAAELARLRAHLEPHFLLNTLNAIAGLVTEEPREARRLIGCLGDLLRDALHDDDELQTLHAQVAWLQRYAAILHARHAGSLAFEWDVAPDTNSVMLPRLFLQPLIENAVKHGALQRSGGGKVSLKVRWTDKDELECLVEDNGPGAFGDVRPGAFGLRAIVRRVELKYPGASVTLEPIPSAEPEGGFAGTLARVVLPRAVLESAAHAELQARQA